MYNVSCNNRYLFFCRLKINHESHEFILDPGTVANIYNKTQVEAVPVKEEEDELKVGAG